MFAALIQNPASRPLLGALESAGFETEVFRNFREMNARLTQQRFDLLLVSGEAKIPERALLFRGIKFIVGLGPASIQGIRALGADDWLVSTEDPSNLKERIEIWSSRIKASRYGMGPVRSYNAVYADGTTAFEISEMACLIDPKGIIQYVSGSFLKQMCTFFEEEFIGRQFLDLVVEEYRDSFSNCLQNLLKVRSTPPINLLLRRSDGCLLPIEADCFKYMGAGRSVRGIQIYMQDSRKHYTMEYALEKRISQQKLISRISWNLLNAKPQERADCIVDALREIATLTEADFCVMRMDVRESLDGGSSKHSVQTFHWANPALEEYFHDLCENLFPSIPWLDTILNKTTPTRISNLEQLPESAKDSRTYLESRGIQSLLVVPVHRAKGAIGVMVLMSRRETRWHGFLLGGLKTLGEFIVVNLLWDATFRDLQESDEQHRAVAEKTRIGISIIVEGRTIYANKALLEMLGYVEDELVGSEILTLLPDTARGRRFVWPLYEKMLAGEAVQNSDEIEVLTKDGKVVDALTTASLVELNGQPAVIATLQDITESKKIERELRRVQAELETRVESRTKDLYRANQQLLQEVADRSAAESRLRKSLEEEEALLRELHHRVKNNLQIILSMLHLQNDYVEEPSVSMKIQEIRNRVYSMGLVHEILCQSENIASINFDDYIRTLAFNLLYTYKGDSNDISLDVHTSDLWLSIDSAIPLGLIINELLSNAIKHAFVGERRGTVRVRLQKSEGNQLVLTVADNGVGLPRGFDIHSDTSLGLQLVKALVGQLGGTMQVNNGAGCAFVVEFNAPLL